MDYQSTFNKNLLDLVAPAISNYIEKNKTEFEQGTGNLLFD